MDNEVVVRRKKGITWIYSWTRTQRTRTALTSLSSYQTEMYGCKSASSTEILFCGSITSIFESRSLAWEARSRGVIKENVKGKNVSILGNKENAQNKANPSAGCVRSNQTGTDSRGKAFRRGIRDTSAGSPRSFVRWAAACAWTPATGFQVALQSRKTMIMKPLHLSFLAKGHGLWTQRRNKFLTAIREIFVLTSSSKKKKKRNGLYPKEVNG